MRSNICAQIPAANLVPENGSHLGSVFLRVGAEFAVAFRPRLRAAMVEQLRGAGATRHDSVEIRVGRDFDMFVFKATPMALNRQRLYFGGQKY